MADDQGDGGGYDDPDQEEGGCGPCARGGGLLLLAVGVGLGWMGADLLTGGALTRLVAGGLGIGAAVHAAGTPAESDSDGDAGEPGEAGDGGPDQA